MTLAKTFNKDTAEKIKASGFPVMFETINGEAVFVFALTQELSDLLKSNEFKDIFFGEKLTF